tara:strand:+ start:4851 stop:4973 length:123 start_codon:yes stop_codon:yes gene_type:complete
MAVFGDFKAVKVEILFRDRLDRQDFAGCRKKFAAFGKVIF